MSLKLLSRQEVTLVIDTLAANQAACLTMAYMVRQAVSGMSPPPWITPGHVYEYYCPVCVSNEDLQQDFNQAFVSNEQIAVSLHQLKQTLRYTSYVVVIQAGSVCLFEVLIRSEDPQYQIPRITICAAWNAAIKKATEVSGCSTPRSHLELHLEARQQTEWVGNTPPHSIYDAVQIKREMLFHVPQLEMLKDPQSIKQQFQSIVAQLMVSIRQPMGQGFVKELNSYFSCTDGSLYVVEMQLYRMHDTNNYLLCFLLQSYGRHYTTYIAISHHTDPGLTHNVVGYSPHDIHDGTDPRDLWAVRVWKRFKLRCKNEGYANLEGA